MLYLLSQNFSNFDFLKSIYLRGGISFLMSFLIVLIFGKPFISFLRKKKFSETIRSDGPSTHVNKKGTPTMGGVLIVLSILFTTLISTDMTNKYIILLVITTLSFAAIGFVDDYKKFTVNKKGLSSKKRLLFETMISIFLWMFIRFGGLTGSRRIDFSVINPFNGSSNLYIGSIGMLLFIILILIGTSNAVNLTDGLDGLVTMPVVICSSIFASIAYFTGHFEISKHLNLFYTVGIGEVTIFLIAVGGAGLGFLWYNFYPAQIFMGDTGSLALGGILGVVAVILKQELLLPLVGLVFVVEAISDILQVSYFRYTGGKRIFKMAPLHHHYELSGLMETKITIRFWITTLICGIIALSIIRMRG